MTFNSRGPFQITKLRQFQKEGGKWLLPLVQTKVFSLLSIASGYNPLILSFVMQINTLACSAIVGLFCFTGISRILLWREMIRSPWLEPCSDFILLLLWPVSTIPFVIFFYTASPFLSDVCSELHISTYALHQNTAAPASFILTFS